jgi:hypothetical protein
MLYKEPKLPKLGKTVGHGCHRKGLVNATITFVTSLQKVAMRPVNPVLFNHPYAVINNSISFVIYAPERVMFIMILLLASGI